MLLPDHVVRFDLNPQSWSKLKKHDWVLEEELEKAGYARVVINRFLTEQDLVKIARWASRSCTNEYVFFFPWEYEKDLVKQVSFYFIDDSDALQFHLTWGF